MTINCECTLNSYLHVVQGVQNQLLEHKFLIFQYMFLNIMCLELIDLTSKHQYKITKFNDLTSEFKIQKYKLNC